MKPYQIQLIFPSASKKVTHKNKSSSGVDFISPKVLKMAVDVIKVPLTAIINSSITQGEFPECWKWAKIIPVFKKKGSRLDKTNYRPVSLLKSASKVLEVIVNQQILKYAESAGILPKSQHGFRAGRSTFSAIAQMHDMWLKTGELGGHKLSHVLTSQLPLIP